MLRKTLILLLALSAVAWGAKEDKTLSPLDRYIEQAMQRSGTDSNAKASPGSVWSPSSMLADSARDVRAGQVDDLVTILVTERASALSRGSVKTSRQSSAQASISAAGGITRATGPLANLAGAESTRELDGQGATTRETVLTTTLSARVAHVLPNGYLVLEGAKDVQVNSERQIVTVRGLIRQEDLSPGNIVRSDRIAQLELRINGKGVVNDAIRRPNFLYRILLGILPF